jgi:hypothetical protein
MHYWAIGFVREREAVAPSICHEVELLVCQNTKCLCLWKHDSAGDIAEWAWRADLVRRVSEILGVGESSKVEFDAEVKLLTVVLDPKSALFVVEGIGELDLSETLPVIEAVFGAEWLFLNPAIEVACIFLKRFLNENISIALIASKRGSLFIRENEVKLVDLFLEIILISEQTKIVFVSRLYFYNAHQIVSSGSANSSRLTGQKVSIKASKSQSNP